MFDDKIKTPDLLWGLNYHKRILNELFKEPHEYNQFLNEVLKDDEFFESTRTSVKDVARRLQISPAKIRKYLEHIYDDIVELLNDENRKPFNLGRPLCSISIQDRFNKYFYIENIQLDSIPRIGETIELRFLYPFFRHSYFEVYKVYHEIDYDTHLIHIKLRHKLNRFAELIKDEDDYNSDKEYYDKERDWFHHEKYLTFKKGEWKCS